MGRLIHPQENGRLLLTTALFSIVGCNALSGASDLARDVDGVLPEAGAPTPSVPVSPDDAGAPRRDEDADSPLPEPDAGDAGQSTKLVFVTSARSPGNMGGLDGADALCNEAASQAGLGSSSWVAWLSTSKTPALSRIKHTGRYAMLDGRVVVSDKGQLGSGKINVPIEITELGSVAAKSTENSRVWTGTGTDGAATSPDTCGDWTSSNSLDWGVMGSLAGYDGTWTRAPGVVQTSGGWGCQTQGHIYCFEL